MLKISAAPLALLYCCALFIITDSTVAFLHWQGFNSWHENLPVTSAVCSTWRWVKADDWSGQGPGGNVLALCESLKILKNSGPHGFFFNIYLPLRLEGVEVLVLMLPSSRNSAASAKCGASIAWLLDPLLWALRDGWIHFSEQKNCAGFMQVDTCMTGRPGYYFQMISSSFCSQQAAMCPQGQGHHLDMPPWRVKALGNAAFQPICCWASASSVSIKYSEYNIWHIDLCYLLDMLYTTSCCITWYKLNGIQQAAAQILQYTSKPVASVRKRSVPSNARQEKTCHIPAWA